MSDLFARVEAMRQQSSAQADAKRAAVRAAMPDDMAKFIDDWKAGDSEVKMTFLDTPTLRLGKEGERGIMVADMVIGPLSFGK